MTDRALTGYARPEDTVIVLFGATGDLAKRKLLPGLFHLACAGLLPNGYRDDRRVAEGLRDDARGVQGPRPRRGGPVRPHQARGRDVGRLRVRTRLRRGRRRRPEGPGRGRHPAPRPRSGATLAALYHLAVPPDAFPSVIEMLGTSGLSENARVICEKPFGHDLASAKELNATIARYFDESQVFRIDHFLGKESVDNIMVLRFANGFFEPIWNRDHVSYVQIDVPEALSIEGRAGFFEKTGTFRDMVVTHLFQMVGVVAMEPPTSLDARSLRDEMVKVFESLRPVDPAAVVRGQYDGYRAEEGVAPDSDTETFVALRTEVDNWRWKGVPFFLRTGKCLQQSRQVVTIGLREPVLRLFTPEADKTRQPHRRRLRRPRWRAPRLPREGAGRSPAAVAREDDVRVRRLEQEDNLEAYEHLIVEAMNGNQALFTRSDGIERLWEVAAPLLDDPPPVEPYARGSWGPESTATLVSPHHWYLSR